jgi:Cu(I)/Ag(I) efflux system protein CusF
MKTAFVAMALALGLTNPHVAGAQDKPPDAAGATAPASPMTRGEVRKIDKAASKITLRHEEIKSMDMPRMTMVFQVADPAMLDKVKAGDKVIFSVEKLNGAFTVVEIETEK